MPETRVVFYQDDDGKVPVLDWLEGLRKKNKKKIVAKAMQRIAQLGEMGYEMRRPLADFLRDGIHELRLRDRKVQPRILYFFHGQNVAILAHCLSNKADKVPDRDIDTAIARKAEFERDEKGHTYEE